MRFVLALIGALLLVPHAARAEVAAATPQTFLIRAEAVVALQPEEAWRRVLRVERWWDGAHTYSGDARNLRLDARAGGCWCERWGQGQSVEHMRVVLVTESQGVRTLRMTGGLGPLQPMGATGVLELTVSSDPAGAKLTMTYRVSGEPGLALDQIAPAVDGVLMDQFGRLVRYSV